MNRLSWAVADNPFFRSSTEKFFPEVLIIDLEGDIVATINPETRSSEGTEVSGVTFCENFRDEKLKLNDDRKIKFNLGEFQKPGYMILLTVRTNDLRQIKNLNKADYNSAWFRLQNEDTFQSLDYTNVKDIQVPEGFEEEEEAQAENNDEEDEEEIKPRNELVYVCGRIFDDQPILEAVKPSRPGTQNTTRSFVESNDPKSPTNVGEQTISYVNEPTWIYEKWNHIISTDQFPNFQQTLAGCYRDARNQTEDYEKRLQEAKNSLIKAAEDRRMA